MKRKYFAGKPPATEVSPEGFITIVVVPTALDRTWKFTNADFANEPLPSIKTTPSQYMTAERNTYTFTESFEMTIPCFANNTWPEKTDIACWWCLHKFDTAPFPCPVEITRNGIFKLRGVFCGPSCAKAWAQRDGRFCNIDNVNVLIGHLARMRGYCAPNKKHCIINPAPPRISLQMFAGPSGLTIEAFRKLCNSIYDVKVLFPPFTTEKQIVAADCSSIMQASQRGRAVHIENIADMYIPIEQFIREKKVVTEIFSGVGSHKISEFFK